MLHIGICVVLLRAFIEEHDIVFFGNATADWCHTRDKATEVDNEEIVTILDHLNDRGLVGQLFGSDPEEVPNESI